MIDSLEILRTTGAIQTSVLLTHKGIVIFDAYKYMTIPFWWDIVNDRDIYAPNITLSLPLDRIFSFEQQDNIGFYLTDLPSDPDSMNMDIFFEKFVRHNYSGLGEMGLPSTFLRHDSKFEISPNIESSLFGYELSNDPAFFSMQGYPD